jgi:cell division protein ZapA
MSDEEFRIRLYVAEKHYPIRCKRSEEGLFRKAAKNINEKILRYSSAFPGAKLELKDLLALSAIHISAENEQNKQIRDTSPLFDKIEDLNKELEDYLRDNS